MAPPYVAVKNLDTYQHYKHRNPPWVKLHYSILDDPAFLALDEVQQCRYIKIIMLASRQLNCISTDPQYLAKVLRTGEHVDVTPLINAGFLIASRKRQPLKMLAPPHENRSQSRVEKSRVEKELLSDSPNADVTPSLSRTTAQELLAYLNEQTGHNYRPVNANLDLIMARLQTATKEEVRSVIDCKVKAWRSDPKMSIYLRPGTLFRSGKFEQYLGQVGSTLPPPAKDSSLPMEPHPIWGKVVYAKDVWYCGCYKNDPTPCRSLDHGKTLEEVQQQ